MEWVLDNWIWILFGVGMIAMHMFGHGGHGDHGGHGGHGGHGKSRDGASQTDRKSEPDAPSTASAGWNVGGDASVAGNAGKHRDF